MEKLTAGDDDLAVREAGPKPKLIQSKGISERHVRRAEVSHPKGRETKRERSR